MFFLNRSNKGKTAGFDEISRDKVVDCILQNNTRNITVNTFITSNEIHLI